MSNKRHGKIGQLLFISFLTIALAVPALACSTDTDCTERGPGFECNASNQCEWKPPVGIPKPEFGIEETYRMYDDPANRNPALTYTQNEEGGYYTHYIDSTDPNATNTTSNPYGSPSKPRRSIPMDLPEGSVVEVHNSTTANQADECNITGVGTAEHPIFVRGVGMPRVPVWLGSGYRGRSKYIIIEGISAYAGGVNARIGTDVFDTSYISIRDCDFSSGLDGSGRFSVSGGSSANNVFHIVAYNNIIHDNGHWDINDPFFDDCPGGSNCDRDNGGIGVGSTKLSYVWIVDNEMYHNEFDGIQVGGALAAYGPHYVYVGRNTAHHNKQSGFWIKTAYDVIFSENVAYGHRVSSSAPGPGMGFQYDPKRVWFLFNHVYDNAAGIICGSGNLGGREEFYFIGNVIHDVTSGFNLNGLNPPEPAMLVGNTIYNTEKGIANGYYSSKLDIVNNIIANSTYQIYFEPGYNTPSLSTMSYNLLEGPINILWGNTYTSLSEFQNATGKGADCIEGDPQFIDAENNDFHLQSTSPAIDSGIESDVYQRFYDLYGIDIRKDIEGRTRPQGTGWDRGALESSGTTSPCGNGTKETGENCNNCPQDVKCFTGQKCCNAICTTPACSSNSDCNTGQQCTNASQCDANCQNIECSHGAITFPCQCQEQARTTGYCCNNIHQTTQCQMLPDCNNDRIDTNENCSNCPQDVKCAVPTICCTGTCIKPECSADSECNDRNAATTDKCNNAGNCSATCTHTLTAECIDEVKLLSNISEWKQGRMTMLALMQKMAAWKTGTGCPPA
jgi:hypothetical protein